MHNWCSVLKGPVWYQNIIFAKKCSSDLLDSHHIIFVWETKIFLLESVTILVILWMRIFVRMDSHQLSNPGVFLPGVQPTLIQNSNKWIHIVMVGKEWAKLFEWSIQNATIFRMGEQKTKQKQKQNTFSEFQN